LIELSNHYNDGLEDNWNARFTRGNNLAVLPQGEQTFAGVAFDVRGVIQLSGIRIRKEMLMTYFPRSVTGIKVARLCRQIHFLHATGWSASEGTQIGGYVIHYANDQQAEVPIRYGEDVRDGWMAGDARFDLTRGTLAWLGTNAAGRAIRVFKS